MKILILVILLTNVTFASVIFKHDSPARILGNYTDTFSDLPLSGGLVDKTLGWPGSHWASSLGSISNRWSSNNPQNFTYAYRSLKELKSTPQYLIDEMSPAEKFDLLLGDYKYKTVRYIRKRYSPNENYWHGICHGVAAAQMNHGEPQSITIKNKDGIELEFYSSDLKALISYFYANIAKSKAYQTGRRCYKTSNTHKDCKGINPASLHIILANRIGNLGEPLIADIDPLNEVWNHVLVSYDSYIVEESKPTRSSARGTVKRVRVQTEAVYEAAIQPKFLPVIGTEQAEYLYENYDYFLELDKNGKIIGGEWISDARPDFLFIRKKARFTGRWSILNDIYKPISL